MGFLEPFDVWLFHAVNQWCGTALWLDMFVALGGVHVFSAVIIAAFWAVWFLRGEDQRDRRQIVLATFVGIMVAIGIARLLAGMLPFRIRPEFAGIGFHPPLLELNHTLENWSAFPSDHATLFFGLAYGLWRTSRPLGTIALMFSSFFIGVGRVYFGIHYPFDIIVGALIGIGCVEIAIQFREYYAKLLLSLEHEFPAAYYPLMFLFTFEVAAIFDDVRWLLNVLSRVMHR